MKRFIYVTIALATVAISCTKSSIVDVPEAQKTPITFDTYNGKIPMTKASEITEGNIQKIYVTGFQEKDRTDYGSFYMNPVNGLNKDSNGAWTYSPLAYWPSSGTLNFVAYGSNTPRTINGGAGTLVPDAIDASANKYSYTQFTYTVPTIAAEQQDLIAGNIEPKEVSTSAVVFKMNHLLSRIGFKLETIGSGTEVKINNITLHGTFNTKAKVNLTSESMLSVPTDSPTTTSYSLFGSGLSFTTNGLTGTSPEDQSSTYYDIYATTSTAQNFEANSNNRYMMILPGEVEDLDNIADQHDVDGDGDDTEDTPPYIEVNYELGSESRTARLPLPNVDEDTNWTFVGGKAYEFLFQISISEIKFTGVVKGWDEDYNGDGEEDFEDYIY